MVEKIVLTGTGCSGLTTTTKVIAELGIPTIPEMARGILEEIQKGTLDEKTFHPLRNPVGFRREQLSRQLKAEARFDGLNGLVVEDRGVFCGIGFCYATGCAVPSFLSEVCGPRYRLVFVLDPIPEEVRQRLGISYHDGTRYEDPNSPEVRLLPASLKRAYVEKGVDEDDIIPVPFGSKLSRARFIVETILRRLDGPRSGRSNACGNSSQLEKGLQSLRLQTV